MKFKLLFAALFGLGFAPLHAAVEDSLKVLAAVGREGQGNEAASVAWEEGGGAGPGCLAELLRAAGTGTLVADNWLRVAGQTIVSNARQQGQPIPVADLEAFLRDTAHAAAGRR